MAAALPKSHLVAVTQKASEFRLLVYNTLSFRPKESLTMKLIMQD